MSKLADVGARIRDKKMQHEKKADEWAQRLDALDQREPEAFATGDAVIREREEDLTAMESDMRQLSNLADIGKK